jgi:hypothetical protein
MPPDHEQKDVPAWRNGVRSVEPVATGARPGHPETTRHGVILILRWKTAEANGLVTRITDVQLPFGGT